MLALYLTLYSPGPNDQVKRKLLDGSQGKGTLPEHVESVLEAD